MSILGDEDSQAKFAPFHVHHTTYKQVAQHAIGATVLIPRSLPVSTNPPDEKGIPLIVRFHAGFLVTGGRMVARHFRNFILELALRQSAILISADYRLMPEASGADILSDIKDLFTWIERYLAGLVRLYAPDNPPVLDLDHILLAGESAGGYCAAQAAFMQAHKGIKALIAQYPVLDTKSDFFTRKYSKNVMGFANLPDTLIDEHLSQSPRQTPVSSDPDLTRLKLAVAIIQDGRFAEFLGNGTNVHPFDALLTAQSIPPMLILHGDEDNAVPLEGSQRFVKLMAEIHPKVEARLVVRPGGHGFDKGVTLETTWLEEHIRFIEQAWLRNDEG